MNINGLKKSLDYLRALLLRLKERTEENLKIFKEEIGNGYLKNYMNNTSLMKRSTEVQNYAKSTGMLI